MVQRAGALQRRPCSGRSCDPTQRSCECIGAGVPISTNQRWDTGTVVETVTAPAPDAISLARAQGCWGRWGLFGQGLFRLR